MGHKNRALSKGREDFVEAEIQICQLDAFCRVNQWRLADLQTNLRKAKAPARKGEKQHDPEDKH